ncbi:hypothetical protein JQK87_13165 [Streptomyces sp. G44]|uniref:hypothetical protein n=1 Tax=Streptomyces sp. G44 TaxID=2807632 RepID=UPI0019608993|nr:hypothetical protein [Streptomyces sp. G44]MBM7169349.1 hypothetical protein [Streptomyces sp. G44]
MASVDSDFERVILTIRLALAEAIGRPLPSFGVALRQYWDQVHPGGPIEAYVRRTGLMGRFSTLLPQQTQGAVSEVAERCSCPAWWAPQPARSPRRSYKRCGTGASVHRRWPAAPGPSPCWRRPVTWRR